MAKEKSYMEGAARGSSRATKKMWASTIRPRLPNLAKQIAKFRKEDLLEEILKPVLDLRKQIEENSEEGMEDLLGTATVEARRKLEPLHLEYQALLAEQIDLHKKVQLMQRGCKVPMANFPGAHLLEAKVPQRDWSVS